MPSSAQRDRVKFLTKYCGDLFWAVAIGLLAWMHFSLLPDGNATYDFYRAVLGYMTAGTAMLLMLVVGFTMWTAGKEKR